MKVVDYNINLENYTAGFSKCDFVEGGVDFRYFDKSAVINVNLKCKFEPYNYTRVFEREKSLVVTISINDVDKILVQCKESPFWAHPVFCNNTMEIPDKSQYVLIETKNTHVFLMPITNEFYNTTIRGGKNDREIEICVNCVSPDVTEICGDVLIVTELKNPYDAVSEGFKTAWNMNILKTPPQSSKKYPKILEQFGWCTWNAFYHDVSEIKIFEKMEEFKHKNIPVKWVLIDDGWMDVTDDMRLNSIYENREKFPNGLKNTVDILKKKYGVAAVGVWYAATGYWRGTGFKDENTFSASLDIELPKGYEFFNKWNSYLRAQGIDFVKIDAQGNLTEYLKGNHEALKIISDIHNGIDKSAKEQFEFIINCMGMDNINMFNRPSSVICRNSDDFFPNKKNILKKHILQNAYNSIFTEQMYFCDFDMWWSEHFEAKHNAVLRAISGGPFYTSDMLGKSDDEIIKKFVNNDGTFNRYEKAAKPTVDCLFGFNNVLKLFNTKGENGVVAMFSFEDVGKTSISSYDFGGFGKFRVIDIFSGDEYFLEDGQSLEIALGKHDVKMMKFVKILP